MSVKSYSCPDVNDSVSGVGEFTRRRIVAKTGPEPAVGPTDTLKLAAGAASIVSAPTRAEIRS